MSIGFAKFSDAYGHHEVHRQRSLIKAQFLDRRVIFSADQLDYTKGIYHRLKAYGHFLRQYPEFREKVVFVMVIVPVREGVKRHAERKRIIDDFISNLNGTEGNVRWQPVVYQYSPLSFYELTAMYSACDVALVTPVRDGMNLVAKEFVASRKDKKGVLILSEMAGAVKELSEALVINPMDYEEIAVQIKKGLEMPVDEQARRMTAMQDRIREHDGKGWASGFLDKLNEARGLRDRFEARFLDTWQGIELKAAGLVRQV